MRTKGALILFVMVFVFASTVALVLGASKSKIASLEGIKEMVVLVEEMNPEAEKCGLTSEQIQTAVELKLRLAGIKVSEDSWNHLYLNIIIDEVPSSSEFYYSISVEFNQLVKLVRNDAQGLATTWSTSGIGFNSSSRNKTGDAIRDNVKILIDGFIYDYLSVNPIQVPVKPTEPKK